MSFWNGYEWTSETSAPTPPPIPKRVGRARDYLATLVMVAAIGFYALPLVATTAAPAAGGPDLSLSPTSGAPGTTVTATGQSLPRRTRLVLSWDGATAGMPSFTTNSRGGFKVTFRVPKTALGSHVLAVTAPTATIRMAATTSTNTTSSRKKQSAAPIADPAAAVQSVDADFDVTATPAATPTPDPTATPDPTPTTTPKSTATPTPRPTATPDAHVDARPHRDAGADTDGQPDADASTNPDPNADIHASRDADTDADTDGTPRHQDRQCGIDPESAVSARRQHG